jgi:hypothetical protein
MRKYQVKQYIGNGETKIIVRRWAAYARAVANARVVEILTGKATWPTPAPVLTYKQRLALTLGQRQRQRPCRYWGKLAKNR